MPEAADAAENVIDIADLSLSFETRDGPVRALSGVEFQVQRGEFVSFIGPSGCGKTTLLRAVADLETPTSGAIQVNGMTPSEARLKRAYGYVFQAPALYPWRTVAKNIGLPLEIMGVQGRRTRRAHRQGARARQPRRFRQQVSLAAVRRHAAARIDRARAGVRSRPAC